MTRSGKENKQGGVLLQKLSKVHKKICQESVRERKRGNVRVETGFGICLQACVTCCLTNGERKAFIPLPPSTELTLLAAKLAASSAGALQLVLREGKAAHAAPKHSGWGVPCEGTVSGMPKPFLCILGWHSSHKPWDFWTPQKEEEEER